MYRANKQQAIPHAKINQKSGIRFFFIRQLLFEENYIGNLLRMSTLYTVDKIFNRLHLLYLLLSFYFMYFRGRFLFMDCSAVYRYNTYFSFSFSSFLFFFFLFFQALQKICMGLLRISQEIFWESEQKMGELRKL